MIIVAIDETKFDKAAAILDCLDAEICMIKIGSVAFNSIGNEIIYYAAKNGFEINISSSSPKTILVFH